MKLKNLAAIAAGAALVLTVSACSSGGGNEATESKAPAETKTADYNPQERDALQEGGEVTFPIGEIPPQMNPFQADGSVDTSTLWDWYNPQLILFTPEGEAYKNDAYLDGWDIETEDGKTVVTFTFNPDAHYNDGTPIDWTAIDTTWKASNATNEAYQASSTDGYKLIESVAAGADDKQAVVTFGQEYAWPEGLFNNILHPAVNSPEVYNTGYLNTPNEQWGAGPYTIDKFDSKGGTITFVQNPEWWGEKGLLDKVTFRMLDDTAEINAFKNGEVDMAATGTKDRLAQVEDLDGVVTYRAMRTATNLFTLDAENPLLSDLDVRKAIFMGIDRDALKEVVWDGLDYSEEPAGSFTLFPFQEGYENNLDAAGWSYDPEAAAKLLEDAGWEEGEDGIREKDGEKLSLTLPLFGDDPIVEARGKVINALLKEIGVDIKIDVRPSSDFSTDYSSKNWDVMMLGFSSSDPFGFAYFCQLWCSDSGLNLSGSGTPELDEKIHALEAIGDPAEQIAEGNKLEAEAFAETWGIFPLYAGPSIFTVKEGLANLTPEFYTGLDGFGRQPVENVGWEK
ncbi:ABC transporter family substrate-binding protein [Agromyces archimandritae]|uniref:ABC transporter family substrate-binding protein n=1 Tax=Agromyces archimandritae TaxID=2781962 RepID=A0A975FJ21_9MICO|nr:ABC transporter family substrate-binding protein [Agromyces archimandritae]QTX03408.1 ABC transporter family substrate-binding protein [Agromyces archimandritae]